MRSDMPLADGQTEKQKQRDPSFRKETFVRNTAPFFERRRENA